MSSQESKPPETVHAFLREDRDRILRSWEELVVAKDRRVELAGLALRDSIPVFLDELADWLETGAPPGGQELGEQSLRHVLDRLDRGFDLTQVLHEYRLLREAIFRLVLESEQREQDRAGRGGEDQRNDRVVALARLNAGLDVALSNSIEQFVAERDRRVAAERECTESALRKAEKQLRTIVDNSRDGINMLDVATGRYVFMSAAQVAMTGFSQAELAGMTAEAAYGRVHPDDRELSLQQQKAIIEGRASSSTVEYRWKVKSGEYRWFSDSRSPVRDESGRAVALVGISRDITHRKEAERELRASEARLQKALSAPTVGVLFFSLDGTLRSANAAFERMSGYRSAELREVQHWKTLTAPEFWKITEATASRLADEGEAPPYEKQMVRKNGSRWWGLFAPTRLSGSGERSECMEFIIDIDARKHAEQSLRSANEALREADRRKSEFLAVLSHELRNPLAPIRNSIYLLERAAPGSKQATRARDVVRRQSEHLTRLVDDLLDVTRISHGKIPLHRKRVDLREIIRKTTDDLYSVFTQAGVNLRVDTGGPMWIDADATRMAQVLTNLLNNAMKFTSRDGTVRVSAAARDDCAELTVIDDGIGMDPQYIEHMFEPFAQADRSLARTKGGLGLGLALVKSIIDLHGGTVTAHSEGLGRGSRFLVRLPLVSAGAEPEKPRKLDTGTPALSVLVIEDNADGAQSLAYILQLHGHHVRVARDGRSGIALARKVQPDVIICDIGLPDVDGYEVARTLRHDGALRGTRLVALSGYAQPEDRQRARDAGFDAHVPKPPDLDELLHVLAMGTPG
jgi:PAS domain S-box-containing protein